MEDATGVSNIGDLLLRTASGHPGSGLQWSGPRGQELLFCSYPCLLREARVILSSLRAQGRRLGDKVVLFLMRPEHFLRAFWCVCSGA